MRLRGRARRAVATGLARFTRRDMRSVAATPETLDGRALLEEIHAFSSRDGVAGRELVRIRLAVEALLRKAYVEDLAPDYPSRLIAQRFKMLSQNEEDGLTLAVLREAGVTHGRFAEMGCGQNGGNSGILAQELGWSGLMVDAVEDRIRVVRGRFPRVTAVAAWVTREGIDDLLREHGFTGEIDLYSIDIDGNDYWVWEATTVISPRLVIVEFNPRFGPERSVVVPYDPQFDRHDYGSRYYGASLSAFARLGLEKGYRLVAVEPRGINAYFLRNDLAQWIPDVSPADVYRPLVRKKTGRASNKPTFVDESDQLYAQIERHDLPLVDLDAAPAAPRRG